MNKRKLKYLTLIISLLCFIIIVGLVIFDKVGFLDDFGYKLIVENLESDKITKIAKFITNLGGALFIGILTIILLVVIKNKRIGICIVLNLVIVVILNLLIKSILKRPRPSGFQLITESGYSFPSGHSMINLAYYGFLIYLTYKYIKNKHLKWIVIVVLTIFVITIGLSRIYLGVHYTSDVLGGFLFSIAYLLIYIKLTKKFISKGVKKYEN